MTLQGYTVLRTDRDACSTSVTDTLKAGYDSIFFWFFMWNIVT